MERDLVAALSRHPGAVRGGGLGTVGNLQLSQGNIPAVDLEYLVAVLSAVSVMDLTPLHVSVAGLVVVLRLPAALLHQLGPTLRLVMCLELGLQTAAALLLVLRLALALVVHIRNREVSCAVFVTIKQIRNFTAFLSVSRRRNGARCGGGRGTPRAPPRSPPHRGTNRGRTAWPAPPLRSPPEVPTHTKKSVSSFPSEHRRYAILEIFEQSSLNPG